MERQNHRTPHTSLWMPPRDFAAWVQKEWIRRPPLNGLAMEEHLEDLASNPQLQAESLLHLLGLFISLNPVEPTQLDRDQISDLATISFAVKEGQFLPSSLFARGEDGSDQLKDARIYLASEKLPENKLSKLQFVGIFMNGRKPALAMLFLLGLVPVLLAVVPELLQQPLFDQFIPQGDIPGILLIGVATISLQLTSEAIGSVSQLYQNRVDHQVDLATRIGVALRFLRAAPQALPQRDAGSWRISLQVAGSFLSSLQALAVSIPLAVVSLVVNLAVIGAFSDPAGAAQLFVVLLIPTIITLLITLLSSNLYIRIMGQQSRLEAIIFEVVKQIRAISLLGTKNQYITRFERSRQAIAKSMVESGMYAASAGIVSSVSSALLYSFIFLQYYQSVTAPNQSQQTVGSLLVLYFAMGTISGSLDAIGHELVSIIQTLPTYWTPNPLRDVTDYRAKTQQATTNRISKLIVHDLSYVAPGIDGPFPRPLDFELTCPGRVALVGPSGSGKSTLLRLLAGHLRPKQGDIHLIDSQGMQINGGLSSIKTLVISQDVRLFGSTLRDVLDPQGTASDEQLETVAQQADLGSVLDSLPLRWKTPVNEYSRDLSLGQLQLFKLARVLLGQYTVVLTDEPTCHLPEEKHLEALTLINDNCELHISSLHRSSGLRLFETVLTITGDGNVEVQP